MKKWVAMIVLLLVGTTILFSHSGGLDSSGGHWDRKNGTYHYHRAPTYTPPPTPTPTPPPPATQEKEVIVFITKSGEKYHQAGCQYLRSSSIPISLESAQARGFGPCSVCKPPIK
jgi:hypothetical protein